MLSRGCPGPCHPAVMVTCLAVLQPRPPPTAPVCPLTGSFLHNGAEETVWTPLLVTSTGVGCWGPMRNGAQGRQWGSGSSYGEESRVSSRREILHLRDGCQNLIRRQNKNWDISRPWRLGGGREVTSWVTHLVTPGRPSWEGPGPGCLFSKLH